MHEINYIDLIAQYNADIKCMCYVRSWLVKQGREGHLLPMVDWFGSDKPNVWFQANENKMKRWVVWINTVDSRAGMSVPGSQKLRFFWYQWKQLSSLGQPVL